MAERQKRLAIDPMNTKSIAVIVGAGWSKAGWPDTSEILDQGAHPVTPAQAARFQQVW